ncbi:MAG: PASTA domain-containing protein [Synergistales bacterium]|nr:PASTA domain-containing protein [Synergistales bacterium]
MKNIFKWSMVLVLLVLVASGVMIIHTIFWGGRSAAIPPMKGITIFQAVEEIEKMGLQARIEQVESTLPDGMVLSQWPEAGTRIGKNTVVILKVSKGGHKISLPDVRGLEQEQAVQKLQDSGFQVGDIVKIPDPEKAAGIVIAQKPSAPLTLAENSRIDLMISLGTLRSDGMVQVPDVLQRTEAVARKMVLESGLNVSGVEYLYTQNTPPGMVMDMSPRPGTALSQNSGVSLKVATLERPETPAQVPAEAPSPNVQVTMPGMAGKIPSEGQKTVKPVEGTSQEGETATGVSVPGLTPEQPSAQEPVGEKKTAKIRYQVPPLVKPMQLKIEMIDASGTRVILDRPVNGGEYISLNESYLQQGVVTIFLGGEFVWQDKYR